MNDNNGKNYRESPYKNVSPENEIFPREHFRYLWKHEEKHFWFRARCKLIAWAIETYFPDTDCLIELGCGNGVVLSYLEKRFHGIQFIGADMFIEGLLPASRRLARSQLIQMDILNPAIKARFDVVGMFDVLEHIDDDDQALVKLLDFLKPGGGAIITVPQHPFLWSASDNVACHKRRYSRKDLFEKLSEAGFKTLRIASFISFLLPFLLLSRWKAKVGDENPILREFRIPHNFNVAFGKICDLELFLMKKGLTMPFGGSLVAIAQKPFHR